MGGLSGKQVFSRFCLAHCTGHGHPSGNRSPDKNLTAVCASGRFRQPAETNKSFPGFVSHTAPLTGHPTGKTVRTEAPVTAFFSVPGGRCRSASALVAQDPHDPRTGSHSGKVKSFGQQTPCVRNLSRKTRSLRRQPCAAAPVRYPQHVRCAGCGAMGGWVGI